MCRHTYAGRRTGKQQCAVYFPSSVCASGTSSDHPRKLPVTNTSCPCISPCQQMLQFSCTILQLLIVPCELLVTTGSRGEYLHSPSTTNLYSVVPGGSNTDRTRSLLLAGRMGNGFFQPLKDPARSKEYLKLRRHMLQAKFGLQ